MNTPEDLADKLALLRVHARQQLDRYMDMISHMRSTLDLLEARMSGDFTAFDSAVQAISDEIDQIITDLTNRANTSAQGAIDNAASRLTNLKTKLDTALSSEQSTVTQINQTVGDTSTGTGAGTTDTTGAAGTLGTVSPTE